MTNETLKRGNEIENSLNAIHMIRKILVVPNPTICDLREEQCFDGLDEVTKNQLKDVMKNLLVERERKLKEEFENL